MDLVSGGSQCGMVYFKILKEKKEGRKKEKN